jgi:hypothetical protein
LNTKIQFDIFLRENESEDMGVIAENVRNKLNFEDIRTYSYCNKTNSIIVSLNDKKNLSEKVKMIEQI